ncbi:MAG TPA: hypothetical protein VFK31_10530, partial [Rhodanobacteraceae bacterium]|nr:hypothetical protein [Rhodanobacteraceae bacterium]
LCQIERHCILRWIHRALRAPWLRTKRTAGIPADPSTPSGALLRCPLGNRPFKIKSLRATPSAQAGILPAIPIEARQMNVCFATCGL